MRCPSYSKLLSIALTIAVTLLFIAPQLNTVHYDPIPEFWSEITFVWIALVIIILSVFIQKIIIPEITIWCIAIISMFMLQPYCVTINFPDFNYIISLEILLAAVLSIAFASIRDYMTIEKLFTIIALAIVIGCILQSIVGFAQYTGMYKYNELIFFYDPAHPTTNIFGNFGQRNHYCQYLTWGVFSLIYLKIRRNITPTVFATLLIWFIFSMTIGASRSVMLYFAWAVALSIFNLIISRDKKTAKTILLYILIAAISLVAIEILYPYLIKILSHSGNHIESGLERISSNSSDQGGRRLIEWSKAWINFKANPIFGSGWNQFAIVSFDLHNLYPHAEANSGLFVNCHNLILQLLSDTGIIGTTLIIVTIARMLYLIIRSYYTSDNLLCMTILFIVSAIIIHSLNEYPLWYIYFLLPFMLLLGIGDKGIKLQLPHKAYAIILLPIAYVIYQIVINSIIFNNLVDYTDVPDDAKSYAEQANYLKSFESDPLWAYQSAYTLDNYISIDDKLTEHNFTHKQQLENTRRLFTETPYLDTSIKLAKLEYLYGDKKYAIRLIESSYIYYPTYIDTFDDALDNTPALAKVIDKD